MAQSSHMDIENTIITELLPEQLVRLREESDPQIVFIIKFGATWCGPCKKIKQECENYFYKINTTYKNIMCFDIDVDDSVELYMILKKRKMVNGLPTILAYYGGKTEHWYIPNDSVSGGDVPKVRAFFERCIKYSTDASTLTNHFSHTTL